MPSRSASAPASHGASCSAARTPPHRARVLRAVRSAHRVRAAGCARHVRRQRREHVVGVAHERRAVADERVAAGGLRPVDVAGKREHGDAAVGGMAGRVERAAARRGFDDDDRVGERRDDRVAREELPRLRHVARARTARRRRRRSAAMRAPSSRLRGGKKCSCPPPSTPIVGAPAASAPSCAAPSMPSASPETTQTPARASSSARLRARRRPASDGARVPTTATHGARKPSSAPATHRPSRTRVAEPLAAEPRRARRGYPAARRVRFLDPRRSITPGAQRQGQARLQGIPLPPP